MAPTTDELRAWANNLDALAKDKEINGALIVNALGNLTHAVCAVADALKPTVVDAHFREVDESGDLHPDDLDVCERGV